MKIRGRKPGGSPAEAAGKVLGVQPTGNEEKKRCRQIVHFGYGTPGGQFEVHRLRMGRGGDHD